MVSVFRFIQNIWSNDGMGNFDALAVHRYEKSGIFKEKTRKRDMKRILHHREIWELFRFE